MLNVLLAVLLVYTPNQLHLPSSLGLPGLNVVNCLFLAAVVLLIFQQRSERIGNSSLGAPLRLYFVMAALATGLAIVTRPVDLMNDLVYLKTVAFYPLYYFLFYYATSELKWARRLVLLVLVVAGVAALEAWLEAIDYGIGTYAETHRAAGPFGPDYRSSNRAGVFYAMFVPLFASVALFMRGRPIWRLAAWGGVLLLAGAVLFTYSRQSYFIALFGLALVTKRRGLMTATAALIVFLVILPWLPQGAFERVEETQQQDRYGQVELDESTESRFEIWRGAVVMWREYPLGVGLNRFRQMIGDYSAYRGKDAHNYYILTLAESGAQGLLALLWLMFAIWRLGRTLVARASDAESRAFLIGFQIAILCMFLGNVYGSPFSEGAVMANFWALAGLLERYAQLRSLDAGDGAADPGADPHRRA